ncbi:MAG: ribonuclease J, partial [Ureaplasma sp.]|nr:ribonuclease J [Ureaplasma sp.]
MDNKMDLNSTYIYALGGLDEIGKNSYVIEDNDSLVIVDAGIKFTNEMYSGFNGMIANYESLLEKKDKIKALIITHGHEDHIGAIPHLLCQLPIKKIIAPTLPVELIKKRLSEHKDIEPIEMLPYSDDSIFQLGSIKVDFLRVCHSIPDSFAVVFETPNGKIVESGDFRFDFATDGDQTNLTKMMEIGMRNIDVLLCESTSSEVPGFSESEKYIIKNIEDYIKAAPGRVFVSTFSSNLSRIEEIIVIAINLNKKVAIMGKSMEANVKISRRLGYLKAKDNDFIQAKDVKNYPDNEVLVILTGSQGEPTAALNMMAQGKHSKISLKPSDTVILSSNPIPGNFAQVESLINNLYRHGVTVRENHPDKKIHSSGHATRSEQQLLIRGINSRYLVPIHGEYKMLKTLKKNATDLGYKEEDIIIVRNGDVLELKDKKLTHLVGARKAYEPVLVNGMEVSAYTKQLLNERNQLSNDGIVNVVLQYSSKNNKVYDTTISTRGCFYASDNIQLLN